MHWQWMQTRAWLLARVASNRVDDSALVTEHSLCRMETDTPSHLFLEERVNGSLPLTSMPAGMVHITTKPHTI